MNAARRRRKPAQKGAKLTPNEGTKSNPSKRHRDRLNLELDRLARLLPFPEDVVSSLDKLSILRLSVSYLRTKSFFSVASKRYPSNGVSESTDHHDEEVLEQTTSCMSEGELLLQTDVMHQNVFELIHTEDQQEFRQNLHWAHDPPSTGSPLDAVADDEPTSSCLVSFNSDELPPENSSVLERSFVCRFRCLLDNSTGFLSLSIQGRLKFLRGQSHLQYGRERTPLQLALFAIATPLQPPAILEIRTKNMIFRTKHKLDFTPMACDAKGKIVLGYTEAELRVRGSGYQFIHAADMLYCAENHVRMIKTGESGLTVFRLLTKDNRWKWVQANARLVYKNGKPDYIVATQRPLVEEEGGEHLRKRSMQIPFNFATGEALLYQTSYPLCGFPEPGQGKGNKSKTEKTDKKCSEDLHPKSLLEVMMSQDESVYCQSDVEHHMSYQVNAFSEQQGETARCGGSRQMFANRETGKCNGKTSKCDPLLATLDSLSLDGDETCSNNELFTALENLGLNAEELEHLLLDEEMIQVEVDPGHVSSLCDLTNDGIISYFHDSMEVENEEECGNVAKCGPSSLPPDSSQSSTHEVKADCEPATSATTSFSGQNATAPSQQMQPISEGGLQFPSRSVDASILSEIPDNHWMLYPEKTHNNHVNHSLVRRSQVNMEHNVVSPLESSQQLKLKQQPRQQGTDQFLLPGMQTEERTFRPDKHTLHLPDALVDSTDCNISSVFHASRSALIGTNYQSLVDSVQPHTLQGQDLHKQHSSALLLGLSQGPPQSPAMNLEQLVALAQPSVEAYSLFSTNTQAR
ncbi:aryl hydrocarbon receptor-like isoform X2 [Nerophis ophidion]|uniref:aryl hydrocarbon receptor-like isoform X2 n=1 Tax=Nerophis ophidion TaxID=159077 RepID=UPI002ADFB2D0|nr:aryl hydrocarbon receptor-like isoform X2 [Nerophis ophidion]